MPEKLHRRALRWRITWIINGFGTEQDTDIINGFIHHHPSPAEELQSLWKAAPHSLVSPMSPTTPACAWILSARLTVTCLPDRKTRELLKHEYARERKLRVPISLQNSSGRSKNNTSACRIHGPKERIVADRATSKCTLPLSTSAALQPSSSTKRTASYLKALS